MGLPLLVIGLLMIVVGARGTYAQFGQQVASEFEGQNSFTYWIIALAALGGLGYVPQLQRISRWAMGLVILAIFLSNKGFFAKFQQALQQGPQQPATPGGGSSIASTVANVVAPQTGNPITAQVAQGLGAGTINQWLQSLPGVGSFFVPNTTPPAF
jgi:hypothetical protein